MTTDNDFVAEKLGLWKHGQGSRPKHTYYGNTTPAPDLLANPWLLEQALVKRGLTVCAGPKWVIIHDGHGLNLGEADTDDNLAAALLKAAADMLRKESND